MAGKLAEKGEEPVFLHVQDACKATASTEYCGKLIEARAQIYALEADVESRRLTGKTQSCVKLIDYKQWVSLLMDKHDKIVSWTN